MANQLHRPQVSREDLAVDVEIESLDAGGDGVARYRGRQLIVPFTIPGERVRVTPGPERDGVIVAALESVLRASPHRITPYCPHFGPPSLRLRRDLAGALRAEAGPDAEPGVGACGGCSWQHIAYPEQLRLKTALVARLVRRAVPRAPEAQAILPGTAPDYPWGYRHKVHFVFGETGRTGRRQGTLVMGHYVRGSRRVIPVRECPVHDERGNALAFRLHKAYLATGAAPAPDGTLKSLAVRVGHGTPEVMGTLVVTNDADKRVRSATRRVLEQPGAPSSFHLNVHPRGDAFVFGRETRKISGPERMREKVADTSFLISPTSFFQTNIHAAEILVRLVMDAVPAGARVLDLYAGAGLFALPLARAGHEVVAVEDNRAAVADGEASLRLNRLDPRRCQFIARRVEQALGSGAARPPFDAVVLDPPREGCAPEVVDRVFGDLAPGVAIYVSCNPEALARDLALIVRHGYRIRSMQPVDMFPHTAHVETVVVLARRTS